MPPDGKASGAPAAGSGHVDAASSTPAAPVLKPPIPNVTTRDEAQECLPVQKGCTISIHSNTRWLVKYTMRIKTPRSRSEIFLEGDAGSHREAVLKCIRWAWASHLEMHPESVCPWMF